MSTNGINTFGKGEHLCKHMLIDKLFTGHAKTMTVWPIRMVYLLVDKQDGKDASVQVLVSVSKRYFKRAVKRNRVKRQIREAYRKRKQQLGKQVSALQGKQLLVAFVWQANQLHDSVELETKMGTLLGRLTEKLQAGL